jgi:ankyrin repeat protein
VQTRTGFTPIHAAAVNNHAGIIAVLVALGVDVNLDNMRGTTPLMSAASKGNTEAVVALLASEKLDPNLRDVRVVMGFCV